MMFGTILAWTAPTTYVNGDPLLPAAITGYHIWVGTSAVNVAAQTVPALVVGPTPTQVAFTSIPGADVGDWFQVSAITATVESGRTPAQEWEGFAAGANAYPVFVFT